MAILRASITLAVCASLVFGACSGGGDEPHRSVGKGAAAGRSGSGAELAGEGITAGTQAGDDASGAGGAGHGNSGPSAGEGSGHGGSAGAAGRAPVRGGSGSTTTSGGSSPGGAGDGGGESGSGGSMVESRVIGPAGGDLTSADGTLMLRIPPGALSEATKITVRLSDATGETVGPVYTLEPDGLTFASPVVLTLAIPPATPLDELSSYRVATLTGGNWNPVPEQWIEYETPAVGALLQHFSDYALIPGSPAGCLCDVDAAEACCVEPGAHYDERTPCSCTQSADAFSNLPGCVVSWSKYVERAWRTKACYDQRNGAPEPRYCTPEWEACCKAAGGIGPIAEGVVAYPVTGAGSETCICDLGCSAAASAQQGFPASGESVFEGCLLGKHRDGVALLNEEAVCGPPGGKGGGTDGAGDGYCDGMTSPTLAGPSGYGWFLYAGTSACADLLCLPTSERVCASLEGAIHQKAVIGSFFTGLLDLSGYTGVSFTADIVPPNAVFDASVSSNNGAHGATWQLVAQAGMVTYKLAFADAERFSDDSVDFDLASVQSFDVSTDWVYGGSMTVTLTDVTFW